MADLDAVVRFILAAEDPALSGAVTIDAGGRTRYGISEKANPEAWTSGPPSIVQAVQIYKSKYLSPFHVQDLLSQDVANTVGDMLVNPGPEGGGILIQEAVDYIRPKSLEVDGKVGPATISVLNSIPPYTLLPILRWKRVSHYFQNDPGLPGLVRRACR